MISLISKVFFKQWCYYEYACFFSKCLSVYSPCIRFCFPSRKIYLVLGSDTAIWDAMDVAKYNCTYNLNLFTAPTSNTAVVMSESFRNPIMDSYGDKLKLMVDDGRKYFRYAANNNIPVNNTMTLHLMKNIMVIK